MPIAGCEQSQGQADLTPPRPRGGRWEDPWEREVTPVNIHQLARDLHELWERASSLQLQMAESLTHRTPREPYRRLALELALQDLLAFAARAEALANFAEAAAMRKDKRGRR